MTKPIRAFLKCPQITKKQTIKHKQKKVHFIFQLKNVIQVFELSFFFLD